LIEEKKNSQRLRDYVEELTSKILENNPSILEATTPHATGSSFTKSDSARSILSSQSPSKNAGNPEKTTSFKRFFKLVS